jgi:glutamyl-tRNA synthetase
MTKKMRVRFAPSPTGALHIGGIRTALYNYLLAKKHGGSFILRIEDTDQARYVAGAEQYIIEALRWCGIVPDEGPEFGGAYGPYRQSERRALYEEHARRLLEDGHAYYAFDTPEELDAMREAEKQKGNHNFKYDSQTRLGLRNSLALSPARTQELIDSGIPYVIRMKIPETGSVTVEDRIRGSVNFQCTELDDKVILKADGMPTYHLANIVDDRAMEITHVIRGEEWLSSTAHHVLLYRFSGWESHMPEFAHLSLILKPNGQGKLSKRDGRRFGFPVFPLAWAGEPPEESFPGFREYGFDPRAVVNFLALLGWNPGVEQEIFSLEELVGAFSLDQISKAGARFDYDKARWFNQQYLMATPAEELAIQVRPFIEAHGHQPDKGFLTEFCRLMKERVTLLTDFWENGRYFFEPVEHYDENAIRKRWRPERTEAFEQLADALLAATTYEAGVLQGIVERFVADHGLKPSDALPVLRLALAGTMQGPAVFDMMALLGKENVDQRLRRGFQAFNALLVN